MCDNFYHTFIISTIIHIIITIIIIIIVLKSLAPAIRIKSMTRIYYDDDDDADADGDDDDGNISRQCDLNMNLLNRIDGNYVNKLILIFEIILN